MRKWLVFILFFGLILFPSTASAEAGVKLDSLNIELLSEYDQPSMLVIHEFVVSRETPLPALVMIRFPKEGNLHAVAVKKDDGKLYDEHIATPAEQGIWQTITIKVESYQPQHIEYYQPLKREGNKRTFKYQWFGDYYVKQFNVTLVVPADSTELITSPALESTAISKNGLLRTGTI